MRRFLLATSLLLPRRSAVCWYFAITSGLLAIAWMGLSPTGGASAAFWGVPLRGFGFSAEVILRRAHVEMARHAWTLATLPFATVLATRPLTQSFGPAFGQLLRHCRTSRLFIESARLTALAVLLAMAMAPYALAGGLGCLCHRLEVRDACDLWASLAGCLFFLLLLLYVLAAIRIPREIAVGLSLVCPFFLTGLQAYLASAGHERLGNFLPPGLPYEAATWDHPTLKAGLFFGVAAAIARLAWCAKTTWLIANDGEATQS